ncbi:RelA/SpoT domain-containing protein [Sphingobacterium sp.]|uniref:RelA/SpoT domain-containing protein n=1 Tax=Sphingobacterium sp. TaxID=341027 RepID=UPI00289B4DC9|nr:RelA/SpoT domain-containing protein [Sphingobacterium sp.]
MEHIKETVELYKEKLFEFEQFLPSVLTFFEKHRVLNAKPLPIIHSIKSRLKDPDHLEGKLIRKFQNGKKIDTTNLFTEITDLIGVRVLHLYQDQFSEIHKAIQIKIDQGDWVYVEPPKAMTWDPESVEYFKKLDITTELRETFYTSIHYLIKPNNPNAVVCCEIQVRTLFEEIWGEIDHTINYPSPTDSVACKEQLRVLSKLVSTGTRLADSIFRSHHDHNMSKPETAESSDLKSTVATDVAKKVFKEYEQAVNVKGASVVYHEDGVVAELIPTRALEEKVDPTDSNADNDLDSKETNIDGVS